MRVKLVLRKAELEDFVNFLEGVIDNADDPRISFLLDESKGAVNNTLEQLRRIKITDDLVTNAKILNKRVNKNFKKAGLDK